MLTSYQFCKHSQRCKATVVVHSTCHPENGTNIGAITVDDDDNNGRDSGYNNDGSNREGDSKSVWFGCDAEGRRSCRQAKRHNDAGCAENECRFPETDAVASEVITHTVTRVSMVAMFVWSRKR